MLPDFQGVHRGHTLEQRQERDHVVLPLSLVVEASGVASLGWVKLAPDGTVIETSEDREKQQQAKDYAKLVALLETHRVSFLKTLSAAETLVFSIEAG